jgi:four helix bundle protein
MKTYKELLVWQKSIALCEHIYNVTRKFPTNERYGLVSQMQRSVVAIPSNIAEGFRRGHTTEYIQFLRISYGSGAELETQLYITKKIGYINERIFVTLDKELEEVMKMLNVLIQRVQEVAGRK